MLRGKAEGTRREDAAWGKLRVQKQCLRFYISLLPGQ